MENRILGGENMDNNILLSGELIDLIVKEGTLGTVKNNGIFDGYCYILEKGNLTFVLDLKSNTTSIYVDGFSEIDGFSFSRKEEIYDSEYGLQLYIDYINSNAETFEGFITEKYADKIVPLSEFFNIFEFLERMTEDVDLDDYNECNKFLKEFGVDLTVADFDCDLELVVFRRTEVK